MPVGTGSMPKAGVFADGHGICYPEFGDHQVAKVDVTFPSVQAPRRALEGPSPAFTAEKRDFGTTRVRRWFGRSWP